MSTTKKTCFKCEKTKNISEFYKHPQMVDGHLNKCKECTKSDTRANREANINYYLWYDRIRGQDPHRVAAVKEYQRTHKKLSALRQKQWQARNTEKRRAHNLVSKALRRNLIEKKPCEVCGSSDVQAHHDDYAMPLVVRWLCVTHHNEHHRNERWFGKVSAA